MGSAHERNLTYATDLAVCVSDLEGIMLSSSAGHAARLGRSIDEVVGRNWREWTLASEIYNIEALSGRVLEGPQLTTILARRNDGRVAASRLAMLPTMTREGRHAILGVHSVIYVQNPMAVQDLSVPLDIACFVADLSATLARVASQTGLVPLYESLEAVAATCGRALSASRSSLM